MSERISSSDSSVRFCLKGSKENLARLDALPNYRTSPLFSDADRAAFDYAMELSLQREKKGGPPST
jgi:hypothetical protein